MCRVVKRSDCVVQNLLYGCTRNAGSDTIAPQVAQWPNQHLAGAAGINTVFFAPPFRTRSTSSAAR